MDRILFYEEPWDCLSNFSAFAVELHGYVYMTAEHAYQAAKFRFTEHEWVIKEIHNARSAIDAKKIALHYKAYIHPGWNRERPEGVVRSAKLTNMESILRAKTEQHEYVCRKLLETGIVELVEDSPIDSFWGRGHDWKGRNELGKLWMKLRQEIREKRGRAIMQDRILKKSV